MLNHFRHYSSGIVTKILIVLLIASFALWGIGDMVTKAGRPSSVAKVGSETISVETFFKELANQNEQIRRSLGTGYSAELVKRLNVPQYVLQRLVQQSLLAQEAERIGFRASDTSVAQAIRSNPLFINSTGSFDKSRFEAMLRGQGYSEKTYVDKLRREITTDELLHSFEANVPYSKQSLQTLAQAEKQPRRVEIFVLSADQFATNKTPTDDELAEFHKAQAAFFTTPEYRTVSYVSFKGADAERNVQAPSEKTIAEYYQQHKDQFAVAEKREVEQLLYAEEDQAKDAQKQALSGQSFADVANSIAPLNRDSLSLGLVDRKSVPENAADEIFSAGKGAVLQPIKSPFGWHVFRIKNIQPAGVQPLESVRATVVQAVKQDASENALQNMINGLEDSLASGQTLADSAKEMGLTLKRAGTFDAQGRNAGGEVESSIPSLDNFVEVAYKTDGQTESSLITSKGGEYYVLRVDSIKPSKLTPLADIKSKVTEAFQRHQADQALEARVSKIENDMVQHKPVADIVKSYNLDAAASGELKRGNTSLGSVTVPPSLVQAVFAANPDTLTSPVRDKNGRYLIARVLKSNVSDDDAASAADIEKIKQNVTSQAQDEMMIQYLRRLEIRYPVSINQEALSQLLQQADASR